MLIMEQFYSLRCICLAHACCHVNLCLHMNMQPESVCFCICCLYRSGSRCSYVGSFEIKYLDKVTAQMETKKNKKTCLIGHCKLNSKTLIDLVYKSGTHTIGYKFRHQNNVR